MTMRVVFRADASVQIGTGHVMRCLTLADALRARGAECLFVTRALPGHLGGVIEERGFELTLLAPPAQDADVIAGPPAHAAWAGVSWQHDMAETRDAIAQADWLVLDHYAFDGRWQQGLRDRVDRIMVIDDLADRPHRAALLLDQNLGRAASDYDGLVPEDCRRLIGQRYALLRPEFALLRETALAQRKARGLRHLMISMGGTDVGNATSIVLRALSGAELPRDIRLSVVMGSSAPTLARVRELAAQMPWPTEVLVDVRDMAALMADADLAIGAGGGTTWERCCLGLPSIIVETAENQAHSVAAMVAAGAALGTGLQADAGFVDRLLEAVRQMQDTGFWAESSRRAAAICAGDGALYVVDNLGEKQWK
jgi:UDP-2,4-diacetamido-2,4,6-trideoxy-beta-L-altropyranose hydrolase